RRALAARPLRDPLQPGHERGGVRGGGALTMARLLAVDDSLTIRKLIENVLGRGGHVLDLAQSGSEGITRAHQNPPDLVLLDYVLPDMKGLDVCASLQTHDALKDVPVIVMSAKGDTLRQLFKDVPSVVGFLHKPFT